MSDSYIKLFEGTNNFNVSNQNGVHNDVFVIYNKNTMDGNDNGTFNFQGTGELYPFYSPNFKISDLSMDAYKKMGFSAKLDPDQTLDTSAIEIRTDYMRGALHLRNVKAEKSNAPTEWTPAPEDAGNEVDKLNSSIADTNERIAALDVKSDSISLSVANVQKITDEAIRSVQGDVQTLSSELSCLQ